MTTLHQKQNPFYDNHLFKKEDLERIKITWRDKLWLWMYPTFVQITEYGVFHYKIVNGVHYLMKVTQLPKAEKFINSLNK